MKKPTPKRPAKRTADKQFENRLKFIEVVMERMSAEKRKQDENTEIALRKWCIEQALRPLQPLPRPWWSRLFREPMHVPDVLERADILRAYVTAPKETIIWKADPGPT